MKNPIQPPFSLWFSYGFPMVFPCLNTYHKSPSVSVDPPEQRLGTSRRGHLLQVTLVRSHLVAGKGKTDTFAMENDPFIDLIYILLIYIIAYTRIWIWIWKWIYIYRHTHIYTCMHTYMHNHTLHLHI